MKVKSLLLTGVSFVLVAAVAIGGTLAYLQDNAGNVNVMTLGNVAIEQLEYERALNEDGTYKTATIDGRTSYVLQPFTQAKPLLPSALNTTTWEGWDWNDNVAVVRNSQVGSYGSMSVFKDAANAQDKFVFVKNTGKTAAYVRTLVAVEIGSSTITLFGFNAHLATWNRNDIGTITVDDNTYHVFEYVYKGGQLSDGSWRHENGVLPAGDMTYNNFAQVYIHSKATNEDMEEIDGNNNGTLDILVLSQAVQAAGFENAQTALDTAFGKSSEKAAEWFGGVSIPSAPFVSTADELKAALEAGNSISLANDLKLDETFIIPAGREAIIDLAGNELSFVSVEAKASSAITNKGTLTIKNGTVTYEGIGDPNYGYGTNTINNSGKLIIDGATIINTTNSGSSVAIDCSAGAELIINSGEIVSQKNAIRLCPFGSAPISCTINGGTITGARAVQIQLPSNKPEDAPDVNLTVNGGTLNGTGGYSVYSYSYGQSFVNVDITLTGGIFNNHVAFGGGSKATVENVTVTGGTFNGELGRYLANDGWEDIAKP